MGRNTKKNATKKQTVHKPAVTHGDGNAPSQHISPYPTYHATTSEPVMVNEVGRPTKNVSPGPIDSAVVSGSIGVDKGRKEYAQEARSKRNPPSQRSTSSSIRKGKRREVSDKTASLTPYTTAHESREADGIPRFAVWKYNTDREDATSGTSTATEQTKGNDTCQIPPIRLSKSAPERIGSHHSCDQSTRGASESSRSWTTPSPSHSDPVSTNSWVSLQQLCNEACINGGKACTDPNQEDDQREEKTFLVFCCNALWYNNTPQYYTHVMSKPMPQHHHTLKRNEQVQCCGKSFRAMDTYRRHMRSAHRQEMLRWNQEVGMYMVLKSKLHRDQTTSRVLEGLETPVTCCNYTFHNVVHLETHLDNVHSMPDWYMRSEKVTAMTQCRESYERLVAQVRRSLHPSEHGMPKVYEMAAAAFLRATNGMIMSWNENVDLEHREAFVRDLDRWRAAETATWGPRWDVNPRTQNANPGSEIAVSDQDEADREDIKVVFENSKKASVIGRKSKAPVTITSHRDTSKFDANSNANLNAHSSNRMQDPQQPLAKSQQGNRHLPGLHAAFINQLPDTLMHQVPSPGSQSDCTFYSAPEIQSQPQTPLRQMQTPKAKRPQGRVNRRPSGLSAQAKEFVPFHASEPSTPARF